jgi:hypothetical protein
MGALWIRILKGNKMHLALFFCELELNFSAIKGNLNGINPEIRVQQLLELHLWLYTYTELKAGLPLFKSEPNLIIRHAEKYL